MTHFLDIDNCIILSDSRKIQKEPAEKKTKTKRQLSKLIFKKKLMPGSESSIYTKLYRAENDGFVKEPTELIDAILKILIVSREDMIKEKPKES